MSLHENILRTDDEVRELLKATKTIAVLGIKPETHANQPAHYVPKYMADAGYDIIPVPVYYPEVKEILGKPVYRDLSQIPGEIDLLNVFRRSEDIGKHTLEILTKKPKAVWFQLGIRNDEVAERFAKAGIKVVQDLCLMVEHRSCYGNDRFFLAGVRNCSTSSGVNFRKSPTFSHLSAICPMAIRRSLTTECPIASNILRIC